MLYEMRNHLGVAMQRLIFVNRFFFPDHSATSQILSDLAFHLAAGPKEVHVITSRLLYDNPQAILPEQETIRGVRVHRLATTRFGRKALLGRGLDYLSFYASLRMALLDLARAGDIIIAKTDPPLVSIPAMSAARQRGAHLVNWLQDLYPEVAQELHVPYIRGPLGNGLKLLRNTSLRRAAINVTVGEIMAAKVKAAAGADTKVLVVPNWTDDDDIVPVPPADNALRREWQLEDKFVIGYSGNLGRAHEFDTVLKAAIRLRDHPQIVFVFIGGGHSFEELMRRAEELHIGTSFRFMPYQDRSQLKYSLGVPDVHLLSLQPELEGLIVPSKFYGIAAAGKPMIAVIARDGEFAPLIERHRCGLVIEPGQAQMLADAIVKLERDNAVRVSMGRSARTMLEAKFTRRGALERWRSILDRIPMAAT